MSEKFKATYGKGRRAEYYVRDKLEKMGATLVIRSAGSHSPADLIAIFPEKKEIWLVQVKAHSKRSSIFQDNLEYAEYKTLEGIYQLKFGFYHKTSNGWFNTFEKSHLS